MKRRRTVDKLIYKLPYVNKILRLLDICGYEPGHYYSPIPDLGEVIKRKDAIFKKANVDLKGVNLEKENQFRLLESIRGYYKEIPYDFEKGSTTPTRYQVPGAWYRYSDVIMLYGIMRQFRPSRIIEIGSGYSSAVMIDTNEKFLESRASMTFVEPFPERLKALLKADDHTKYHILESFVQDLDLDIFRALEANDILFIDSSHVSKIGSDLNFILFEILPILRPGVLIHFHDIYYPFELPEHWVLDRKWFWNENYILRAYLTGNSHFSIINFNSYLQQEFREWFSTHMPSCLIGEKDTGSIWLRKNA
jgi:predicted O-methyltransferase YrrM